MIGWFKRKRLSRIHQEAIEHEKMRVLERAERDVEDLKVRGERAVTFLIARDERNHWRESVRNMIQGVH